jgi:hypothetical protein
MGRDTPAGTSMVAGYPVIPARDPSLLHYSPFGLAFSWHTTITVSSSPKLDMVISERADDRLSCPLVHFDRSGLLHADHTRGEGVKYAKADLSPSSHVLTASDSRGIRQQRSHHNAVPDCMYEFVWRLRVDTRTQLCGIYPADPALGAKSWHRQVIVLAGEPGVWVPHDLRHL